MINFGVRDDGLNDITAKAGDRKRWRTVALEMSQLARALDQNGDEHSKAAATKVEEGLRFVLGMFTPKKPDEPTTIGPPPKAKAKADDTARKGATDE